MASISIIIGASAGVGRALATILAENGKSLLLVASDTRDLDALKSDITNRYDVGVWTLATSVLQLETFLDDYKKLLQRFSDIECLAFPIGYASEHDTFESQADIIPPIIAINLSIIPEIIKASKDKLESAQQARIVGFGSIAGARGRDQNVIYSAAKRGLESYFESLRHYYSDKAVRVQFYKLGYVDTQQSFGKDLKFPVIKPQIVAQQFMRDKNKDFGSKYYPRFWGLICTVLRFLPWFLYKKLKF